MTTGPYDLVLVGFRDRDTHEALRFCDMLGRGGVVRRKVLVMNRPEMRSALKRPLADWTIVDGSNAMAEFSGWQEGLDHLRQTETSTVGVVFVNDSVCTHRKFTAARRHAFSRALGAPPNAALIGFRDQVPGELSIAGFGFRSWASTYCFALTDEALRRLGGRLYDADLIARCVPGGLDEATFFAELSPDLNRHLRHWLFDGAWYGGARLAADNTLRLQAKAFSIAAEKLLSARADACGVVGVDPFERYRFLRLLDKLLRRL